MIVHKAFLFERKQKRQLYILQLSFLLFSKWGINRMSESEISLLGNSSICVVGAELFEMFHDFLDNTYREVLCFICIKCILKILFFIVYGFDIACFATPLVCPLDFHISLFPSFYSDDLLNYINIIAYFRMFVKRKSIFLFIFFTKKFCYLFLSR